MRGALFVAYLAALFFLPLGFRRREALRIRQTEEFLLLLRRVKREVACFSRPLPDICRRADLPALDAAGFFDALAKNDPATAFRLTPVSSARRAWFIPSAFLRVRITAPKSCFILREPFQLMTEL